MFSSLSVLSILRLMPGLARQIFNRMLIPTVIVGLWGYGYFESVDARNLQSTWFEGGTVRCANPYTAPVLWRYPATADDDNQRQAKPRAIVANADS